LTKKQRIAAFVALGEFLQQDSTELNEMLHRASIQNPWYTPANTTKQIQSIAQNLTEEKLNNWLSAYPDLDTEKTVGLILAGNIPLVGFHDLLTVLISGFTAQIKVSSDDAGLTNFLVKKLLHIAPSFQHKIQIAERLQDFDLIIATGSDNSSRYFEYYFGKKPHIIRKNRNSAAVLDGKETKEALKGLGHDIFDYFGLGCRSVSKLYIPKGYDIAQFFEGIEDFKDIKDHYKYANNYDYNKSIYLINGDKHYDNGFLLLKEDGRLTSPLATVFYEEYEDIATIMASLNAQQDKIQCLVSEVAIETHIPTFPLGQSQCPALTDYADGVNTLDFLFANA